MPARFHSLLLGESALSRVAPAGREEPRAPVAATSGPKGPSRPQARLSASVSSDASRHRVYASAPCTDTFAVLWLGFFKARSPHTEAMAIDYTIGNCLEVLKDYPPNHFDSCVTDPPYGLEFMGKEWDKLWAEPDSSFSVRPKGGTGPFDRKRASFGSDMVEIQAWHTQWAKEVYRVLKPGAHLLAMGGTRTSHRLACALEDAGFEIRDTLMWLYGSGFPKSLDVSKAIDKRGGKDIAWFGPWLRKERRKRGISSNDLAEHFPSKTGGTTGCVRNWELGRNIPTADQFNKLCEILELPFENIEEAERKVIGHNPRKAGWFAEKDGHDITMPASPEAAQWQGWGTALKPAYEPIILARKPLESTVAQNVLKYGTGGMNIDASRVGYQSEADREGVKTIQGKSDRTGLYGGGKGLHGGLGYSEGNPQGRWPANVILTHHPACVRKGVKKVKNVGGVPKRETRKDVHPSFTSDEYTSTVHHFGPDGYEETEDYTCHPDCPIRILDAQSGERPSGSAHLLRRGATTGKGMGYGSSAKGNFLDTTFGDTGGASRFFYIAKASREERERGLRPPLECCGARGSRTTIEPTSITAIRQSSPSS